MFQVAIYANKLNIKTNLLEEYVNSVDTRTKQNTTNFKILIALFVIIIYLFIFFSYLNTKMNNTFSLEEISKTGNLDFKLIFRQHEPSSSARFIEIKSLNAKLRQEQMAKEVICSSSNLRRYRDDVYMLSQYRIPSNSHKRKQKIPITNFDDDSHREHHLRRPQMTPNDLKIIVSSY